MEIQMEYDRDYLSWRCQYTESDLAWPGWSPATTEMAESGKSTGAKQPWVRPSWPDFEGATVTVTHLICPQGVGSEGKQQAL